MNNLKRLFRKTIDKLVADRDDLSKRISALEVTYRLLSAAPAPSKAKVKKAKKRYKKERTLDKAAADKTLAFIKSRKRPTRPEAVEREFNLTRPAATQRLINLVNRGLAKRVGTGRYVDIGRPAKQVKAALAMEPS